MKKILLETLADNFHFNLLDQILPNAQKLTLQSKPINVSSKSKWKIISSYEEEKISRTFTFKDYHQILFFLREITLSNQSSNLTTIINKNKVKIILNDDLQKKVINSDLLLAKKIDKIYLKIIKENKNDE